MKDKYTGYDIIGDIHGCSHSLKLLLETLGYTLNSGIFQHPSRKVLFLGDFIDRNTDQRGVIDIVRPMIETGTAMAVMGNHEFNAIAYFTPSPDGNGFLREHNEKNNKQHKAFLDAYAAHERDYADVINWFKTLPLWLNLDGLHLIHACWDKSWILKIEKSYTGNTFTDTLLQKSCNKDEWEYDAIETLLKGKEIPLTDGKSFFDKDGNERNHIRIRWWDKTATTYKKAFMGPESAVTHIPDDNIDVDHLVEYSYSEKPVFLGHYWLEGKPQLLATNIACVDYSVAKESGKLAAYRWDGEQQLSNDKFVWVDRQED